MGVTTELAAFCAGIRLDKLPPEVVNRVGSLQQPKQVRACPHLADQLPSEPLLCNDAVTTLEELPRWERVDHTGKQSRGTCPGPRHHGVGIRRWVDQPAAGEERYQTP